MSVNLPLINRCHVESPNTNTTTSTKSAGSAYSRYPDTT